LPCDLETVSNTCARYEEIFYLGLDAPRLTPKEIDLLHRVLLEFNDKLPAEELHHHVVHFAVEVVMRAMASRQTEEILEQLREHLHGIQSRRPLNSALALELKPYLGG